MKFLLISLLLLTTPVLASLKWLLRAPEAAFGLFKHTKGVYWWPAIFLLVVSPGAGRRKDGMMKVWQVRPQEDASHRYNWVTYGSEGLRNMGENEFRGMDIDTVMEVRAVEMTQEEFEALQEHKGW